MKKELKDKKFNYERSRKISYLNWKNINLMKQVREELNRSDLTETEKEHLERLRKNISECAFYSLYNQNTDVRYIGSHTCNHRACNICNYQRQKRIRRKYFRFFTKTPDLIRAKTKSGYKVYTENYFNELKKEKPEIKFVSKLTYNLMHLTLTIKHSDKGFNGNKYYFGEVLSLFHKLRNSSIEIEHNQAHYKFTDLVYGGEFGIETTKNDNGLHIHLHGLLFVKKMSQSRNVLHKLILKNWNKYTVNKDFEKREFNRNEIAGLKKSNTLINDAFIKKLDSRGTILIGLENIYYYEKGKKVRPRDLTDLKAVQRAVLETISYHFKPGMFETDKEQYNMPLIIELLPHIYKKRLYGKFGCLYYEKNLSLAGETMTEDFAESKDLTAEHTSEGDFFIIQPAKVYHIDDKIIIPRDRKKEKLSVDTTTQAINLMNFYFLNSKKHGQ